MANFEQSDLYDSYGERVYEAQQMGRAVVRSIAFSSLSDLYIGPPDMEGEDDLGYPGTVPLTIEDELHVGHEAIATLHIGNDPVDMILTDSIRRINEASQSFALLPRTDGSGRLWLQPFDSEDVTAKKIIVTPQGRQLGKRQLTLDVLGYDLRLKRDGRGSLGDLGLTLSLFPRGLIGDAGSTPWIPRFATLEPVYSEPANSTPYFVVVSGVRWRFPAL